MEDDKGIPLNMTLKPTNSVVKTTRRKKKEEPLIKEISLRKSSKPIYNVSAYVAAGIKSDHQTIVASTSSNSTVESKGEPQNEEAILLKLHMPNNAGGCEDEAIAAFNSELDPSWGAWNESRDKDMVIERQASYEETTDKTKQQHNSGDTRVVSILKDFEEKNKLNEWPATTQVACYWCCNKFENSPLGIPVRKVHNKYHVYGCFCSLPCAVAYNFSSHESMDDIYERYSLLNMLSYDLEKNSSLDKTPDEPSGTAETHETPKTFIKSIKKLRSAPSRLALTMFGGHMTIEEFRSFGESKKFIHVNFPPMMTMTLQVEEINDSDIHMEHKYVPIDVDRVNKYKEKVMLRRTKPLLSGQKNTLDSTMNIRCDKGNYS